MDEAAPAQYWCHMCSQVVNPVIEADIKCPYCQDGFVEEMSSTTRDAQEADSDFGSDRALSLWAPILLGMMGNPRRRQRIRRLRFDDEDDDEIDDMLSRYGGDDPEFDREIESMIRRRRNSATILQLLQGIRAGMASELENPDSDLDRDRDGDRETDRVLLVNPFNQTIILRGSGSSYDPNDNSNLVGSLGDYFIGPGLDLLLQHLAENDPNRHGTPPARKEAIEALPTVAVKETSQCSICLDDLEIGAEAKEMPCKHGFHCRCILPWLEIHSSCPVCRFQLPADESKLESSDRNGNVNRQTESEIGAIHGNSNAEGDGRNGGGRRRFTIPWPFTGLFSSSSAGGGNSTSSSSSSSANAHGSPSPTDEN